jgi:hypothetical protein
MVLCNYLHISQGNRYLQQLLLASFDSFFIAVQSVVMIGAAALAVHADQSPENKLALVLAVFLIPTNIILLPGLDATSSNHRFKSTAALFYGLLFATLALKAKSLPGGWQTTVDLSVVDVVPAAVLQSAAVTVFIFCAKYFVKAFVWSQDAVVLSCPLRVKLEHVQRSANAAPQPQKVRWEADPLLFSPPKGYELLGGPAAATCPSSTRQQGKTRTKM